MKQHIVITTVPGRGLWSPGSCLVCQTRKIDDKRRDLPAKPAAQAFRQAYLECDYGHRTCCHVKDFTAEVDMKCPKCDRRLINRVEPASTKRVIRVTKKSIQITSL